MSQRKIAFGHADEIHGITRRHAQRKRLRISQADVLDGHAHHATRDVQRVFSRFKHSTQPVKRCVGIAVPHRFMQGRDQVVVFFARLVVEQDSLLYRVLYDFAGDLRALFLVSALGGQRGRYLQNVICTAGIAARVAGDSL